MLSSFFIKRKKIPAPDKKRTCLLAVKTKNRPNFAGRAITTNSNFFVDQLFVLPGVRSLPGVKW